MLGLMVLAKPMLMVLFMRGEFSPHDVNQASLSLLAYASGLLNFMLIKVLAPGYYARQDTKTPVRYGIIAMITNMFFNAIFAYFYGYVGLAMATALSALVNMALLYRGLHLANVYKLSKETLVYIGKLIVSGGVMVTVLVWFMPSISVWLEWDLMKRMIMLIGFIGLGALSYLITAVLFGLRLRHLRVSV